MEFSSVDLPYADHSLLIHALTLRVILSFGPDTPPLAMQPLNVPIGPNGSGKSNLLEAIGLLRCMPTKLTAPMRGVGGSGVKEWIWKGAKNGRAQMAAAALEMRASWIEDNF
jgi:hypothetical protein